MQVKAVHVQQGDTEHVKKAILRSAEFIIIGTYMITEAMKIDNVNLINCDITVWNLGLFSFQYHEKTNGLLSAKSQGFKRHLDTFPKNLHFYFTAKRVF